jgi:hypothetical protein
MINPLHLIFIPVEPKCQKLSLKYVMIQGQAGEGQFLPGSWETPLSDRWWLLGK